MAVNEAPIRIIGCGPGAAEYVTPAARAAVLEADVLAGDRRLLALFPESKAERLPLTAGVEALLDEVARRRAEGRRVALLVSGDPGLFSLAQPAIRRFGREACRVMPGISSVQLAFARLMLAWDDARIISAHAGAPTVDPVSLRGESKIAILLGSSGAADWAARAAATLGKTYAVFLCENLALSDERVRRLDARRLAEAAPASRSIVVLVKESELT